MVLAPARIVGSDGGRSSSNKSASSCREQQGWCIPVRDAPRKPRRVACRTEGMALAQTQCSGPPGQELHGAQPAQAPHESVQGMPAAWVCLWLKPQPAIAGQLPQHRVAELGGAVGQAGEGPDEQGQLRAKCKQGMSGGTRSGGEGCERAALLATDSGIKLNLCCHHSAIR